MTGIPTPYLDKNKDAFQDLLLGGARKAAADVQGWKDHKEGPERPQSECP